MPYILSRRGPKLPFRDRCRAFAALYDGSNNFIVERAFGLSRSAVSKLNGCLEYDPEPYAYDTIIDAEGRDTDVMSDKKILVGHPSDERRQGHNARRHPLRRHYYEDVRREFEALGVGAFMLRYYDDETKARMSKAMAELRAERNGK